MLRIIIKKKRFCAVLAMIFILALVPFAPATRAIDDTFAEVSAGYGYTMAIKKDGSLWGWGGNGYNLGDGISASRTTPVKISLIEISVILDGRPLTFDVPPMIVNGRTMAPLRAIFEALGATIDWNQKTQAVTAKKGDTVIELRVGDASPIVNGKVVPIDQPSIVVNGRVLVPLRFVAEAFGVKVDWRRETWTAVITS